MTVKFSEKRADEVLITPFKKYGYAFLKKFEHLHFPRDLLLKLPKNETQERKALISFFGVLFDSQKQSRYHYKDVLKLYTQDPNFFTLDRILSMNEDQAKTFASTKMGAMDKKGIYLLTCYSKIKNEYGGSILNVLDVDVIKTQKRLETFLGYGDALAGLLVHTLRDYNIFKFDNEQDLCPKIDFHDYNIGVATGIIKNGHKKSPQERKRLYSEFIRDVANKNDVNIFDLDSFMWAIGQLCVQKNVHLCEYACPLHNTYSGSRTFYMKNDYDVNASVKKQKVEAKKLEQKINWNEHSQLSLFGE